MTEAEFRREGQVAEAIVAKAAKRFKKAVSEQAFFKVALYGKAGSGKTLTALLWAEYLSTLCGKRIAFIDTERGSDFYAKAIRERKVHSEAFDFDRLVTRSLMETIDAVESIDPNEYGVLIIDTITHLWEAAQLTYTGKRTSMGGIPVQAWNAIKRPYKKLMGLFLDGSFHAIICGREGVVIDKDEDGEMQVTGTRMKAEGETPHEPHILGRMAPLRDAEGGYIIRVFFEKDRSGILTGREFEWPTAKTIAPVVAYLSGTEQGKLGTLEDNIEKDVAAIEAAREREEAERYTLFQAIKTAIGNARNITELKSAWELTKGKKTRLGDELYEQLSLIKEARKAEILKASEVV